MMAGKSGCRINDSGRKIVLEGGNEGWIERVFAEKFVTFIADGPNAFIITRHYHMNVPVHNFFIIIMFEKSNA